MIRLAALAAFFAGVSLAAGAARAERLTVALSTTDIPINSSFTGTLVTIFGAIERDAGTISRANPYEVVVRVLGPPQTVVARRKDRILGIWANAASETMIAVPGFYAVSASDDLAGITKSLAAQKLQIGYKNIAFSYVGRNTVNEPAAAEFRDAFVRLKQEAGLYHQASKGVEFIGDSIFRSSVWVPANVPIGEYRVAVYLFSGDALLTQTQDSIQVSKTGAERFMFNFAHRQAAIYGLVCVALAMFTGWLGGVVFRRD